MAKKYEGIRKAVEIPDGVILEVKGREVIVKKGGMEARNKFRSEAVQFEKKDNKIVFTSEDGGKKYSAIVNTFASRVRNMCIGVQTNYIYRLKIVHAHFPITAQKKENVVEISNFTGEKKPRLAKIIGSTQVEVKGKDIMVRGPSKEDTSQTASNIEKAGRVKGRDLRVFQDGIYLVGKGIGE